MKYLEECIDSVLSQDFDDYDVWAYDNESADGTYEYLLELEKNHSKLKVIQVPNIYPNGYGEAQEHVAKNIKSDYVTFVASDDIIDPNYISKCMKIFSHDPENIKCIQSGIIGIQNGMEVMRQTHSYKDLQGFKQKCIRLSPVNTPTVVWHSSLLRFIRVHEAHDAAGISCIGAGDYDTYCHMADQGIFIYPVPASLGYYYRWHEDQATWKVHESKKQVNYDKIIQEYWKKKWTL
jgi:glycosyltransferase involved in cell wall biosynthesis